MKVKNLNWIDWKMQICSVVQLSGFFLCLMGAARITHRAQGIVSIATKWHMLVTNASSDLDSDQWKSHVPDTTDDAGGGSDSDDSSDIYMSITPQQPSSFQTRQALGQISFISFQFSIHSFIHHSSCTQLHICIYAVTYLQHNNGGVTLYGFALDRGLLHTLFAFEFSLVLWILSKVVVLSWPNLQLHNQTLAFQINKQVISCYIYIGVRCSFACKLESLGVWGEIMG